MRLWPTALLALLLAGCANVPGRVPAEDPAAAFAARRTQLEALQAWRLQGRAAVRNGDEGGGLDIDWWQNLESFRLEFSGPLGSGRTRLSGDPGQALLEQADGSSYQAQSAADLLYQAVGWAVPVQALRGWVLGLPDQGAEFDLDRYGRMRQLRAGQWLVTYADYAWVDGIELPNRLSIERGDLHIRLAVDSWRLGADSAPDDAPAAGPFSGAFGD